MESEILSFIERDFQDRKKVIFQRNRLIFSCIKGTFNDNIDTILTSETYKAIRFI